MDAWTFRKRITVAVLALIALLVVGDYLTGSQGVAAMVQVARVADAVRAAGTSA